MFQRILWPVDGSSLSFKPIQEIVELAKMAGGKIIVLSIAQPRLFNSTERAHMQDGQAAEEMNLAAARENVQQVREVGQRAGVDCESIVSMAHLPCTVILETAQIANCDVIVMATRGKTGVIETIFKESTTQEVLRSSPIPVLVFPRRSSNGTRR